MSVEREAVMRMRVIGDPRNASTFEGVATGSKKAASAEDELADKMRRATQASREQASMDRALAKDKAFLVSQIEREKAALERQRAMARERKAAGLDGDQGLMGDIAIARQMAMFRMATHAMTSVIQGITVAMDKSLTPAERFEKTLHKLPFGLGQLAESASSLLGPSPIERTRSQAARNIADFQYRQQQQGILAEGVGRRMSLEDEQVKLEADALAANAAAAMRGERAYRATYGRSGMESLGEQRLSLSQQKGSLGFQLSDRQIQEAELRERLSQAENDLRIAKRSHKSTMEQFGNDPNEADTIAQSAANLAGVTAGHERARSQLEENISKQRELQIGLAGKELELLKHQRDVRKSQLDLEIAKAEQTLGRAEKDRSDQASFAMMDRGEQEMALAAARRFKEHGLQSLGDEERRFIPPELLRSAALRDKGAMGRSAERDKILGIQRADADQAFLDAMGAEQKRVEVDATIQLDAAAVATKLANLLGLRIDEIKVLIDKGVENKLRIHEQGTRMNRVQGGQ